MTLKELMRIGEDHAKEMMVGTTHQYLTQFTLVKPNDRYDICATPWGDGSEKRDMVFGVCLQAIKEGAVAYSFCTEAWFASSSFKGPQDKQPPPVGPPPSERPDRKEGIVLIASDGTEHLFECWEIVRGPDGICAELDKKESPKGFESWITDALDRALTLVRLDKDGKIKDRLKDFLNFP